MVVVLVEELVLDIELEVLLVLVVIDWVVLVDVELVDKLVDVEVD